MLLVLPLGACDLGQQKAQVYCKANAAIEAFQCEVKHTQGTKALNVCWDVEIDCDNGQKRKASACQEVAAKGTATRNVPFKAFDTKDCKPSGLSVKNLKLKIKK
jgi:xylose isomerase